MKIILTGATGFIGLNFLSNADNEHEYICLIRKSSNYNKIPKRSNFIVKKIEFTLAELTENLAGADVVIHMIGQMGGYGVPYEIFQEVNCQLTQDMLDACKTAGVKQFIYLSTPGVQGFGKRLCTEEVPYAPRNSYEETKVQAEQLIKKSLSQSKVHYTIIRPDFVYGPGDYRRIKIYKNIRDKKFVLTTSGKSYLHPTYVIDVIQGIVKAIDNPNAYNEIFNISAKEDLAVQDYLATMADYFHVPLIKINIGYHLSIFCASIIEKICNVLLKKDAFVSKNKIDFLALDHSTSNEKAQRMLGYESEYDFKKGFALTMTWCKENNLM